MSQRSVLAVLMLVAIVFLTALVTRGRALNNAAPAALPPGPLAARWIPYKTFEREADNYSFSDPVHHRLYLSFGSLMFGIDVYNTDTGALLKHLDLNVYKHAFGPGNERLYLIGIGTTQAPIHVLDPVSLAEIRTLNYVCGTVSEYGECTISDLAEGPDGRLYVSHLQGGAFDVLDGITGAVLDTVAIPSTVPPNRLDLAAAGDTLYVGGYFDDGVGVQLYDIGDVIPSPGAFHETTAVLGLTVSPDDRFLYANENYVNGHLFGLAPFGFLWQRESVDFLGFFSDGGVLVSQPTANLDGQVIAALNPQTGGVSRSISVPNLTGGGFYSYALPLAGGDLALLRRPEVTLLNVTDYAIALPTVFNEACPGGPFVDHFDDPDSGWPSFDDEFTADYVNGAYRIDLPQPGRWAAVTRGDYWRDSSEVQLRGGQPPNQDGTFGLIFGLDANWTDFYTAEIYPAASKWALFHFSDGQWQLLSLVDYQYPSATGSTIRITRNPLNGETKLDVDGYVFVTLPNITGRVGLMASAFGTPVTATFDVYRFVGAHCDGPSPGEATDARVATGDQPPVSWASASSSVLRERPPLGELFEQ